MREPLEVKRRVGYLPDWVGFYDNLTARENLRYTARLAGIPRAEIEQRIAATARSGCGLAEVGDKRVGTYSRGMRQRLGLAEVLMKGAEVAILDEPTSGLDPEATFELLDMIRGMKADGIGGADLLAPARPGAGGVRPGRALQRRQDRARGHRAGAGAARAGRRLYLRGRGGRRRCRARLRRRCRARRSVARRAAAISVSSPSATSAASSARAVVGSGGALLRLAHIEPSLDTVYRHYFEGRLMARRSGSAFTGAGTVFLKEFADHLGGARVHVLEWLVLLTGAGAVYTAIQD